MIRILALAALLLASPVQATVTVEWVTVGDPGNSCDVQGGSSPDCFGAVANEYRIGKYEVSNAGYAEFLNSVAATDANALYNTNMGSGDGGITRSGSSGSYTYSTMIGRETMPVNFVSFYDNLRFANWLHNGQPTGAQDNTTTEDGAYDLSLGTSVVRKAGVTVFLTSEDEWYKAAYYKGGGTSAGYWGYPAESDTQTTCAVPGATANTANCNSVEGGCITGKGSFTESASPSGTFDQGGNVWERNEDFVTGSWRGARGGLYTGGATNLAASLQANLSPDYEGFGIGFRVASLLPASPPVPSLSPFGIAALLSLLGLTSYWKLRSR